MRRLAHERVGVEERAQHVQDLVEAAPRRARAARCLPWRRSASFGVGARLEHQREPQQLDDVARERQQSSPSRAARSIASSAAAVSWPTSAARKARTSTGAVAPSSWPVSRLRACRCRRRWLVSSSVSASRSEPSAPRTMVRQRRRLEGDLLLLEDGLERRRHQIGADRAEVEALHAREDGGRQLARVSGGQHHHDVRRLAPPAFEQRVEASL
jgi:hypothetical protein